MTIVTRTTGETQVRVAIGGEDAGAIATTAPFLDHMLRTLARYSALGLSVQCTGDLRHHIIEDVALGLGAALRRHAPATAARYGSALVPMDDALVQCAVDIGGRPFYEGPLPSSLYDHFMRSLSDSAAMTLHLRVIRGRDRHHVVEAGFKALGLSLRQAFSDSGAVFSTKGAVALEVG